MDLIYLAQDRGKKLVILNVAMNFKVPLQSGGCKGGRCVSWGAKAAGA